MNNKQLNLRFSQEKLKEIEALRISYSKQTGTEMDNNSFIRFLVNSGIKYVIIEMDNKMDNKQQIADRILARINELAPSKEEVILAQLKQLEIDMQDVSDDAEFRSQQLLDYKTKLNSIMYEVPAHRFLTKESEEADRKHESLSLEKQAKIAEQMAQYRKTAKL